MRTACLGPPRFPRWAMTKFAVWVERHSLVDDLDEEFADRMEKEGRRKARAWYWVQVLRSVPSVFIYSLFRSAVMTGNYAKIALRNIRKQKAFSFINIVGLAVGLSICLFAFRLIVSMYGSDAFHEKKDRIYRVVSEVTDGERSAELATAPFPLAQALGQRPDVENVVRIKKNFGGPAVLDDKVLQVQGLYADRDFFKVFSFPLEAGDPETALIEPFSLVLAKELAGKFFGQENPVGRTLSLKGTGDFKITGVLKDVSKLRSHMRFECLASLETLAALERRQVVPPVLENWDGFYETYVYFLLRKDATPFGIEDFLLALAGAHYPEKEKTPRFSLQALTKISPGSNLGNFLSTSAVSPQTPLLLISIAVLIVVIACFNYANLSLAKAFTRAKEVGIRKAIGANRRRLVAQFIGEAVTTSLVALVLALFLLEFVVPRFFNRLPFAAEGASGSIALSAPAAILLAVLIGVFAGTVPAVLFSKFDPVTVLRDATRTRLFSRLALRRGLAVFQFFVSFFFIITTLVVFLQVRHVERIDRGFRAENILNVELGDVDYGLFKQEISNHPAIIGISATDAVLCTGSRGIMTVKTPEAPDFGEIDCLLVDENFLKNFEIPLLAGRSFPAGGTRDGESFTIINEKAVDTLHLSSASDAIGKRLIFGGGKSLEIIGVVKNFASQSLDSEIRPLVLRIMPKYFRFANIRIAAGDRAPILNFLAEKWKKLEPYEPFRYGFLEDQIAAYLAEGRDLLRAVSFVAFLAIMIAFFGLLGMVIYDTDARVKEIGIRKVMGASVPEIVIVLSRGFVDLLVLGALLATPVAWFVNNMILRASANRIRLGPGIFGLGFFFMLALGLAIILTQTIRAATGNPVDSLRYE